MGLRKRWYKNFLLIPTILLTIVAIISISAIKSYYYSLIRSDISSRLDITTNFYSEYIFKNEYDIRNGINKIYRSFTIDKSPVEYQIISDDRKPLFSSEGLEISENSIYNDFDQAIKSGKGQYIGRYITGERVMILSKSLIVNGELIGVVRCITTLTKVDRIILDIIKVFLLIESIVIVVLTVMGYMFSRSIINPIKEVAEVSAEYGRGNFRRRITNRYKDELGELVDSINHMASELERQDKIKKDFISSISHELRTPLTAIKGWTQTLIYGGSEEEINLGLSIINKESERLSILVEDILDFSVFNSVEYAIDASYHSIKDLVDDVYLVYKKRCDQKGIELILGDVEDKTLLIDVNRIKQVLINVVDNSIKYSRHGDRIKMDSEMGNDYYILLINDTGMGIEKKDLNHITKMFYRGRHSIQGTGLGLAISKELIELHGGYISIDSTVDEGTTVRINIPMGKDE